MGSQVQDVMIGICARRAAQLTTTTRAAAAVAWTTTLSQVQEEMIGICAKRVAAAWTAAAVANGLLAPWLIQIASLLKSNFLLKLFLLSSKSLLGKILVWKMSCVQIEIHLIHDTSE